MFNRKDQKDCHAAFPTIVEPVTTVSLDFNEEVPEEGSVQTALRVARQLKMPYSDARLTRDPTHARRPRIRVAFRFPPV